MAADTVLMELADGVLTMTLNRPDKRNAMDSSVLDGIHEHLDRAELDPAVAVVALRGAGNDFCAGADLAELLESVDNTAEENEADAMRLGNVFIKIRKLPKPVVAVIKGRAFAGGCGLATSCDLVLAHEDASFGYPEVRRGFAPAMVMAMLRRAVGEKIAFDLVCSGHVLTAREALAAGLVSRVLDKEEFEESTNEILHSLGATSPSALALTKRLLYEIEGRTFEEAVALGAKVNAIARATPDFKAGVAKFLRK